MKYTWEVPDVRVGRLVDAHNRSERYIIGYDPTVGGEKHFTLVSLRDGMLTEQGLSAFEIADRLNTASMRPVEVERPDFPGDKKP